MYYLNKVVYCVFINPVGFSLLLLAAGAWLSWRGATGRIARATGRILTALAFGWLLFFSLPASMWLLGLPLERAYPVATAESAPEADAIVILGGGMAANTNALVYAEMNQGADRVWHAVRLYRAGKAPLVLASGIGERSGALPLLRDFGVPPEAIVIEGESRNTEENAKFTERILRKRLGDGRRPRILLVTSAWHMRRSVLMFERYAPGLEILPAPADYEATCAVGDGLEFKHFLPAAWALAANDAFFKERIGYWGYRLLR